MNRLQADNFSGIKKDHVTYTLERNILEYHLETITNRNEAQNFEIFCRKLCERAICSNLRPHTSHGGDSKVDTETYPVSDEIADRFYIGEAKSDERWGFAFSASKDWKRKVKNDVQRIAESKRGYKRIIFITSRFAKDRSRSEIEDSLSDEYGIPVIIHDRSWIIQEIIDKNRKDLAFDYLGVGEKNTDPYRLGREYGKVAIEATKHIQKTGEHPRDAWDNFAEKFFGVGTNRANKICPRSVYLGLCEDGLVVGVSKGNYLREQKGKKLNKLYAAQAVHMLCNNPYLENNSPNELWNKVIEVTGSGSDNHDYQMDVVLALWNGGMIVKVSNARDTEVDYDLFSERGQAKQEPIPYQYDKIPHRLHEQILYVLKDISILESVWDIYCRQTGMPSEINNADTFKPVFRNIMRKNDIKSTFDIIEIAFQFSERQGVSQDILKIKTDELNNYFRKASFGYQLKENRMVRITDYPMDNKIYVFYGALDHEYKYYLPQDLDTIPAVAGNYMFAAWRSKNEWQVFYVGETEDLRNRLVNNRHEKMTDARVGAHPDPVYILYDANQWNEGDRRNAEKDLIKSESPPLNSQYPIQNDENTQQNTGQERIASLAKWFHENYQDPVNELPYDKEEHKYIFVYGGPYDANDVLTERFPEEPEEIIKAAVKEIESDGIFDWSPIQHEGFDKPAHGNLEDIKKRLNSLITNAPASRIAPAFDFGDDGLLHTSSPLDLQDVASDDRILEGLKVAKDDLDKALVGTNSHLSLLEAVEQYNQAFFDEQISISLLYVQGIRLENAVDAIRQSINSEDLQPFSIDIERNINSVLKLHKTYIMLQEEGKILVEASYAYSQSPQQTEEIKEAAEKLNKFIASDTSLFGKDVKKQIDGVVQDIGRGSHPERSNQVATITFLNLVSGVLKGIGNNPFTGAVVGSAFVTSVPGASLSSSGTEIIDAVWSFLPTAIPLLKIIVASVASDASWMASLSDLVDRLKTLLNLRG